MLAWETSPLSSISADAVFLLLLPASLLATLQVYGRITGKPLIYCGLHPDNHHKASDTNLLFPSTCKSYVYTVLVC